jgi:hypothetical protein
LLDFDGEVFPADACAITLSVLLQDSGIAVKDTFPAIALGNLLKSKRGWQVIAVGEQKEGDIGSTCGPQPDHGRDHIYLVLKVLNSYEMVVADKQAPQPHFKWPRRKNAYEVLSSRAQITVWSASEFPSSVSAEIDCFR